MLFIVLSDRSYSQAASPDLILAKASQKLNSLKTVTYSHSRELNYSSENYHNLSKWTVFIDFQSTDTVIGIKYQIDDSTFKQVFNGTEKFEIDGKKKTLQLDDHPSRKSFSNLSAFYNSIVTFKNILPLIINDKTAVKTISDTVINDKFYHLITYNAGKRRMQNLGKDYDEMRTKNDFIYK